MTPHVLHISVVRQRGGGASATRWRVKAIPEVQGVPDCS